MNTFSLAVPVHHALKNSFAWQALLSFSEGVFLLSLPRYFDELSRQEWRRQVAGDQEAPLHLKAAACDRYVQLEKMARRSMPHREILRRFEQYRDGGAFPTRPLHWYHD